MSETHRIAQLERDVAALARQVATLTSALRDTTRAAGLRNSAIDDGSLAVTSDGSQTMRVGVQYDGSSNASILTGPTPPTPTVPTGRAAVDGAIVNWDGMFTGDGGLLDVSIVAPMDWSRLEVHASQQLDFVPLFASTLVGTFESPRGGDLSITLPTRGTWAIRFVARTLSGAASAPSPVWLVEPNVTSVLRTAKTGARWEIDSATENQIRAYSGHPHEVAGFPSGMSTGYQAGIQAAYLNLFSADIQPPGFDVLLGALLSLTTGDSALGGKGSQALLQADHVKFLGETHAIGYVDDQVHSFKALILGSETITIPSGQRSVVFEPNNSGSHGYSTEPVLVVCSAVGSNLDIDVKPYAMLADGGFSLVVFNQVGNVGGNTPVKVKWLAIY